MYYCILYTKYSQQRGVVNFYATTMPLLFSYGTLQQENVQLSTLGRRLSGEPDALLGFEQSLVRIEDPQVVATSGKTHHPIVRLSENKDSRVPGTVFEITDAELANIDAYEVALYKRMTAALASGREAWVYVDRSVNVRSSTIQALLRRDLAAVRRSVEAYPEEASLWADCPGLPNPGGTLVLHVAGNLQHYIGAVLGRSGYQRNRNAEFTRRGVARSELLAEVDAAMRAVDQGLGALAEDSLAKPYPEPIAGRTVSTGDFLMHLAVHLAYHLGQLDYHRRLVTRDQRSVGALAITELPVWSPEQLG